MSLKDIEKLREKFDKDPNSKLFLPLAEEYRKEGMLDDAIEVLHAGLEKHTAYTSARVLLGKIYHEKGMMDEARKEFESVIKIVPDNLFAHKKLAEIYRDTGEAELAIKECKAILKLNPMDEETLNTLKEIEAASSPVQAPEPEPVKETAGELRMPEAETKQETAEPHLDLHMYGAVEAQDVKVEHSEAELNSFKASLFGDAATAMDDVASEDIAVEAVEEVVVEDEGPVAEELASAVEEAEAPAEIFSLPEDLPAEEETSFASIESDMEAISPREIGGIGLPETAEEPQEEILELSDETFDIPEAVISEEITEPRAAASAPPDLSDADRYVSEGRFYDAMNIYKRMLSADASNRVILQRVEELRALLKLMGKDKEVLVARLNSFLEGINKRRDEFLRHS